MKKCIDFLIDFLIDFWKVFGRVSVCILALKINEKCMETLMKKIIDFLHAFLSQNASQMGGLGASKRS